MKKNRSPRLFLVIIAVLACLSLAAVLIYRYQIEVSADAINNESEIIALNSKCQKELKYRPDANDFIVGAQISPGFLYWDLERDIKSIKSIANTLFIEAGNEEEWDSLIIPTLDIAQKEGLKTILTTRGEQYFNKPEKLSSYYDALSKKLASHPTVIGIKIADEAGNKQDSTKIDGWLSYLKISNQAIRKNSNVPILIDVIPWEFWRSDLNSGASSNAAIDHYVDSGYIDGLLTACDIKYTDGTATKCLPKAINRWGNKVKIYQRAPARFEGTNYEESPSNTGKNPGVAACRLWNSYSTGASGIHYWVWRRMVNTTIYQTLDSPNATSGSGGTSNPLFEAMVENFSKYKTLLNQLINTEIAVGRGFTAISTPKAKNYELTVPGGMTLFSFNREKGNDWTIKNLNTTQKATLESKISYYLYNPGGKQTATLKPAVSSPDSFQLKKGWNLVSNSAVKDTRLNETSFFVSANNSCENPSASCPAREKTLTELYSAASIYKLIYLINANEPVESERYFSVFEINSANINSLTIPSKAMLWVYLF